MCERTSAARHVWKQYYTSCQTRAQTIQGDARHSWRNAGLEDHDEEAILRHEGTLRIKI